MHLDSKNILIASYEIPGYGGAATAAYDLFGRLQRDGLNISYVNLIGQNDSEYFRIAFGECYGNPRQLPNVYNHFLTGPVFESNPELKDFIEELAPDLIIAVSFI